MPTDLIQLIPPELPGGQDYCWNGPQRFAIDIISRTKARLNVSTPFFWNYGADTPSPENRVWPWFNTGDGNVYQFSSMFGMWIAKPRVPASPNGLIEIWKNPVDGTASGLWTFDGGDGTDPTVAGNVTAVSGSFWTVETTLSDGRAPIGKGTMPSGLVLNTGDQVGDESVTLDKTQMPYHAHNMPDPISPSTTVPIGTFQAGSEWRSNDSPTLKIGQFKAEGGDPTTHETQPFSIIPRATVVVFIKRTSRAWLAIPG